LRLTQTMDAQATGCEHDKHDSRRWLVFDARSGGSLELKFSLETKPEIVLLNIAHAGSRGADRAASVSVGVNGTSVAAGLQVGKLESTELDVSNAARAGDNSIKITVLPGETAYLVSKVELRVVLPEEEMRKERASAATARKRLYAQLLKDEKEKRRKADDGKKLREKWPPAISVGQAASIFNGRDLSGWQSVGQATWTVREGFIAGINSGPQPARLMSNLPGYTSWRDYAFEVEATLIRGALYVGVHGAYDSVGGFRGSEVGPGLQPNSPTKVKIRVAGADIFMSIGGGTESKVSGSAKFTEGAPYISLEPNTEVHVKSATFTLQAK
jgi:hypothetical protein